MERPDLPVSGTPEDDARRQQAADARAAPLDRSFVLTLAGATAVILFLYMVRQALLPFVAAGIIAFICEPLVRRSNCKGSFP